MNHTTAIERFQKERTEAISEMFDGVDENGIYPTSRFFARIDKALQEELEGAYRAGKNHMGCAFSGPGRGDCEHFVGLYQQDTDEYGKPLAWCWWCWHKHQLEGAVRAERERVIGEIEGMLLERSPYVRNHGLKDNSRTTITNAYRDGFNQALEDLKEALQPNL